MKRVVVIGSPGSGKSIFARALAKRTGLPLIHLDAEYHLPGWVEPPEDVWQARLQVMVSGDRWIIDGNYGGSMDLRLARADVAIWLDYPTGLCLWRALKRIVRLRGSVRPDAAPGCPERLDWEFLHYILVFRRAKTPATQRRLAEFDGCTVRFHHPAQAQAFLQSLA